MSRIPLVAVAVCMVSLQAQAESVSVTDRDGKIWVMQIEPAGTVPAPKATTAPMPIVEPTAVDLPEPATTTAPALPVDTPEELPTAPETASEVTAAKPVVGEAEVATTDVPEPSAPITAPPIIESQGMVIIPRGSEPGCDITHRYLQIYNAIPFNRAEYVANPAYRHDATMELLTGTPRPTAGYTGRTVHNREYTGYRPYIPSKADYYRYRYPVGYGLYGYGRLPYIGLGY